jgi:hypothetical protein
MKYKKKQMFEVSDIVQVSFPTIAYSLPDKKEHELYGEEPLMITEVVVTKFGDFLYKVLYTYSELGEKEFLLPQAQLVLA